MFLFWKREEKRGGQREREKVRFFRFSFSTKKKKPTREKKQQQKKRAASFFQLTRLDPHERRVLDRGQRHVQRLGLRRRLSTFFGRRKVLVDLLRQIGRKRPGQTHVPLPEERLRLVGPQRARRGGREARDVGRALLLVEGVAWGLVEKGGN